MEDKKAMNRAQLLVENNLDPQCICLVKIAKLPRLSDKYGSDVWIMGVNARGESVACRVIDFYPSLLYPIPPDWADADEDCDDDIAQLFQDVKLEHKGFYPARDIVETDVIHVIPLIGFTNGEKHRMLQIKASTLSAYYSTLQRYFGTRAYHTQLELALQVQMQLKTRYTEWFQLTKCTVRNGDDRMTSCQHEFDISLKDLVILPPAQNPLPSPPLLRCYLRLITVSRQGLVTQNPDWHAQPTLKNDRILAIQLRYQWLHIPSKEPHWIETFNWVEDHTNELTMLRQFRDHLTAMDPDVIVTYDDDMFSAQEWITKRFQLYGVSFSWERIPRDKSMPKMRPSTRIMINLMSLVGKKISTTSYQLHDIASLIDEKPHEQVDERSWAQLRSKWNPSNEHDPDQKGGPIKGIFVKSPPAKESCLKRVGYTALTTGKIQLIGQALSHDCDLIRQIESENMFTLELLNISRVSSTDMNELQGGEQVRCFHLIARSAIEKGYYLNPEKLAQKPLRFPISRYETKLIRPPEHPLNIEYRQHANEKYKTVASEMKSINAKSCEAMHKFLTQRADQDPDSDNDDNEDHKTQAVDTEVKESQGGNVIEPAVDFYDRVDEPTGILDVASMYPSIMMAYKICYNNLVYDLKYNDLPGVEYTTIPINAKECIRVALCEGVLPELERTLVAERAKVRKQAKEYKQTDKFLYDCLDKAQLALKVLGNALYGYLMAYTSKDMYNMAEKALLLAVTAIGRAIQQSFAWYLAHTYQVVTIYGDTDSIVILLAMLKSLIQKLSEFPSDTEMDSFCHAVKGLFHMDEKFCWNDVKNRDEKFETVYSPTNGPVSKELAVRGVCYLIFEKFCRELSALFPSPIKIEFEAMLLRFWIFKKKNYTTNKLDLEYPNKLSEPKIQGMEQKKRDWCNWSRRSQSFVTYCILNQKMPWALYYIAEQMERLILHQIPVEDLMLHKKFKSTFGYANEEQLQKVIADQIQEDTGMAPKPGSMLCFIVIENQNPNKPKPKLSDHTIDANRYLRQPTKYKLDRLYYLERQFYSVVLKAFALHPNHLAEFQQIYQQAQNIIKLEQIHRTKPNKPYEPGFLVNRVRNIIGDNPNKP